MVFQLWSICWRGKRLVFQDIFGKQREGTMMAACDCDGFVTWACEWIQGTMDSDRFVRWEQDALCPVFGQFWPGEKHSVLMTASKQSLITLQIHAQPKRQHTPEGGRGKHTTIHLPSSPTHNHRPLHTPLSLSTSCFTPMKCVLETPRTPADRTHGNSPSPCELCMRSMDHSVS